MKRLIVLLIVVLMTSCSSDYLRLQDAQKKFPHLVITPPTSFLQKDGCSVIGTDTLTGAIYCIRYRPGYNNMVMSIMKVN
jgi:hypothetical protein